MSTPPRYILALDQGTTGSTALVLDAALSIVGRAYQELPQHFPQLGWVEHDPEDIFGSVVATGRAAIQDAGLEPSQITAIGITNQRETTLLWDRRTGVPVHPAIVWQCRRTAPICEAWRRGGLERTIRERTGLVLDAYFSASKLRWLLDQDRSLMRRAYDGELAFGTVDSWLIWRLTNGAVHATDPSNASRTLFYNLRTGMWDSHLLYHFDLPHQMLPEIRPSASDFGRAAAAHLGAEIPICGVAGDQQAALFGQTCFEPGEAKCTYGTGCFLMMNLGEAPQASQSNLLTTVGWSLSTPSGTTPLQYALEGSVFSAGSLIGWLRDGLGFFARASESEALASSVPDNGGVYLVPAFNGLGAPHWDMYARGTLVGLTRDSGRGHITRAALEAVAYQTRDLADAMADDAKRPLDVLRVDGGMVANDLLMQFQADILGIPVERPVHHESTALGAGCLAGLASGVWSDMAELRRSRQVEKVFEPRMGADQRAALHAGWKRAVERARGWVEPAAKVVAP